MEDEIDLSSLEPLLAKPSSPGNVVPVREVAGEPVSQVVVGSSANPGLRDFAVVAEIVRGHQARSEVSFDVNPTSREILEDLVKGGWLLELIKAGARVHQSGCMGCIGMGQAPATGRNSLRTVPRNFPGRSGTREDSVWLCSPETAAAAALTGQITDPRQLPELLGIVYPKLTLPEFASVNSAMLEPPLRPEEARRVELVKGPHISGLPELDPLRDRIEAPVALKVGDDISTDEIMPAGARVLPYRSNIPEISKFAFSQIDETYVDRVTPLKDGSGHLVVAGDNYGQGSSREHAAIAPGYLGLRAVLAKSYARIHWQNLANFGILALEFAEPADYDEVRQGDTLMLDHLRDNLAAGNKLMATNQRDGSTYELRHRLSPRQVNMVLEGGQIPLLKKGPPSPVAAATG